jgi:hypothetical protein
VGAMTAAESHDPVVRIVDVLEELAG